MIGHSKKITSLSFSPDGTSIVTGSEDKLAIIWDAKTGDQIGVLKGHQDSVNIASYFPDGKRIVTISHKFVMIWDANTGSFIGESLKGHSFGIKKVYFSSDSTQLITVCT